MISTWYKLTCIAKLANRYKSVDEAAPLIGSRFFVQKKEIYEY